MEGSRLPQGPGQGLKMSAASGGASLHFTLNFLGKSCQHSSTGESPTTFPPPDSHSWHPQGLSGRMWQGCWEEPRNGLLWGVGSRCYSSSPASYPLPLVKKAPRYHPTAPAPPCPCCGQFPIKSRTCPPHASPTCPPQVRSPVAPSLGEMSSATGPVHASPCQKVPKRPSLHIEFSSALDSTLSGQRASAHGTVCLHWQGVSSPRGRLYHDHLGITMPSKGCHI